MVLFVSRIFVFGAALSGLGVVWFGIVLPLADQATTWLRTGKVPVRDLLWAQSPRVCDATSNLDIGLAGKELCRRPDYFVDGWIGVTQVLNWFGHQHVAIFSLIYSAVVVWAVFLYQDR